MALFAEIKRKSSRIKGADPDTWVSVTGPVSSFSREIRKSLSIAGLSKMGVSENGKENWSILPAVRQNHLPLLHYLSETHGVTLPTGLTSEIKKATGFFSPPDPGGMVISRNQEQGIGPGNRPLVVRGSPRHKMLLANCHEEDEARKAFLRGLGFLPVRNPSTEMVARFGSQPWYCCNAMIARQARPFMTEDAKLAEKAIAAEAARLIKRSTQMRLDPDEPFTVPVPEGLDYLDFQKVSIKGIVESGRPNGVITDDMGLGKTVQGLGIINGFPEVRNALILCEANMKEKWALEARKWLVNKDLTIGVAYGSTVPETNVVVMNYDLLSRNPERMREILDTRAWDIQIMDEAHNLKEPDSQRTRAVLGDVTGYGNGETAIPVSRSGGRILLTGTPRPNEVTELWPLLTTAFPTMFGTGRRAFEQFRNRYAPPKLIEKELRNGQKKIIAIPGKTSIRNEELFISLRATGMIRRLKRDTDIGLKMKVRTPIPLSVKLTPQDNELLREAEADIAAIHQRIMGATLHRGEGADAGPVIDLMARLTEDAPDFTEIARVRRNLGLVKAPYAAKAILDEMEDHDRIFLNPVDRPKIVIFAHHKEVITTIRAMIEDRFPESTLVFDGSTKAKDRQPTVDRFQNDDSKRVIILSGAGITGITLTRANIMRIVEPDWTPAKVLQLEDRIYRIGQEKDVDIGYIHIDGTLDGRIGKSLMRKMSSEEKTMNSLHLNLEEKEPEEETGQMTLFGTK